MEQKDTKLSEIIDPKESLEIFTDIDEKLKRYVELGSSSKLGIRVDDPQILTMWKRHIKPFSDQLQPMIDKLILAEEETKKAEEAFLEKRQHLEDLNQSINGIRMKRNKFIARVSPMIIRNYGHMLNRYQQFGSIIEDNGAVFVTVLDWFASFMSGQDKKNEQHQERVASKISPKIATAEE